MLTQFISQDLRKRNKKLSTSRGPTPALILPINLIRSQKEMTKKISHECESTYSKIEGLRSDVTFIKKEIEIDFEKKKRNKRAKFAHFPSAKENKLSKRPPSSDFQSQFHSNCQTRRIKRKLSNTCMTNNAFKEGSLMAGVILHSKKIFPQQKLYNR